MAMKDRLLHAWNAFRYDTNRTTDVGMGNSRPGHKLYSPRMSTGSIASTIFNQIAVDASMVDIFHVKIDEKTLNEELVKSGIQNCLSVEANIDQSNRDFIHDLVFSMFDEGVVAVCPVDTDASPDDTGSYKIETMRIGKIVQWYPSHVRVLLYNDRTGKEEELMYSKGNVAIVENPLYSVVNGQNSTLMRLISKMALLDLTDKMKTESSGKLDLLVQLPYAIKTEARKKEAEERLKALKEQLTDNKYGVAYVDAAEKFTQLNRSLGADDLATQVAELTKQLYNQLGLTETIFNGTASEAEMRTYYSRTIDPILTRITAEFKRKFLTKTARSQGHTFTFRRDVFKLVPVDQVADIGDKMVRNQILSPNELRKIIGYAASDDPKADELRNPNIADKNQNVSGSLTSPDNRQNE